MARTRELTAREKDFAWRVARNEDPSSAMIRAGYARSYVRGNGSSHLLRRPLIKAEIERCRVIEDTNEKTPIQVDLSELPEELQRVFNSKALTGEQLEELKKCADPESGLFYWLKHYCWTWDRARKRKAEYPLWPFQRAFLKELEKQGCILVEKSRDLMVTWTVCEYMLWHVQFDPYWTGFATSRREAEVDNGGAAATTASIFGRIRFSWMEQPAWLRTALKFSHLKIVNQEEGMHTEITGESANPHVGRSSDVFFKWGDEFALVEQSEKAHAAMLGGGFNTLLYTSTSNLTGNEFYRLRSKKDSGFRILRYSWEDRPDRNEKWYAAKSASMTSEQKAKELDIQYEITGPALIWKKFDPRIHVRSHDDMPMNVGIGLMFFDEGYAHPGALYYGYFWGGVLYVVGEIYKAGVQLMHPEVLRDEMDKDWVGYVEDMIEKFGPIETICVGHESRGFEDILTARGHSVYRVGKDHLNRIRIVDEMLGSNGNGHPGLLIDEECVELRKEIPKFKWKVVNGLLQDYPAGGVDHGCDSLQCVAEYLRRDDDNDGDNWVSAI